MAKKKRKSGKAEEPLYEVFSVKVDSYDVASEAGTSDVYAPQYAVNLDLDDPLYEYRTRITLLGTRLYPPNYKGHRFEISLNGEDAPSSDMDIKLKDVQKRDTHGAPEYRNYRKQHLPVFRDVKGIACLDKLRGEGAWSTWLRVSPDSISDMLQVLKESRMRYVSIDTIKYGRHRWVRRLSIQTTYPEEE